MFWASNFSPVRPFARSPVRPFARSPVRPFARSPVRPFARSPVRPFAGEVASKAEQLGRMKRRDSQT